MSSFSRAAEVALERIRGEYLEMPGLKLTAKQAGRLWGLDEDTCMQSLQVLVEAGFLARTQGSYVRRGDVFPASQPIFPPPRPAKAGLAERPRSFVLRVHPDRRRR